MLSQSGVQRLVIDLRLNGGGNSAILDPWITEIKSSPLSKKGSLFVIIGRATFSSAIMNAVRLRKETAATLIGEPTAGKPNHFGEVRSFELPNSSITVSYSTKYFRESDEDSPSLMPDMLVEQTSADYLAGRDPVLDAIMLDAIISSPRK
jgi:C-terminal processing protease CtpA/Prc